MSVLDEHMKKEREKERALFKKVLRYAGLAVAAIFAVTLFFSSVFSVRDGTREVVELFGKVWFVAQPGLNFKPPLISTRIEYNIREQKAEFDKVGAYTADSQASKARVSVTYRLRPGSVAETHLNLGPDFANVAIFPKFFKIYKSELGKADALEVIASRSAISSKVESELQTAFSSETPWVEIISLNIENLNFSPEFEQAAEDRLKALVAEKAAVLNGRAKIATAEAEKQATIKRAEGSAEAVKLAGDAEAHAIREKGEALRDNPGLVSLITAQTWNGVLPQTMVPNAAVPFVSVR